MTINAIIVAAERVLHSPGDSTDVRLRSPLVITILTIVLILTAVWYRLPELSEPGFYGDEETTAMVARSVAAGEGFRMPSGMYYFRALPLTALNALTAKVAGPGNELAYRLPSALLGALTPAILFLLARLFVPTGVALIVGFLVGLSEWHIITSQEARMYAPFMLSFSVTGMMIWRWADCLTPARISVIAIAVAMTSILHNLGLLVVLFPVIWLTIRSNEHRQWRGLLIVALLPVAFHIGVSKPLISGAFKTFRESVELRPGSVTPEVSEPFYAALGGSTVGGLAWLVGALIGAYAAWRILPAVPADRNRFNHLAVVISAAVAGGAYLALHLYGAVLAAVSALLLYQGRLGEYFRRAIVPTVLLSILALAHWLLTQYGPLPRIDFKDLFLFPYPYFHYLWQYSSGIFVFFWAGVVLLIVEYRSGNSVYLKASALVALYTFAGVGVAMQWGGMRYLIGAYPFLLLVAAYPLYKVFYEASRLNRTAGVLVATMIAGAILVGILGGHGVRQAADARDLTYGDETSVLSFGFEVYPDHEGAGQYVKDRLAPEDIVVAADVLQQYWYVGRVDYWLTNAESSSRFIYLDGDGLLRDIYVNSKVLESPGLDELCKSDMTVVWVITSAERTEPLDRYYSPEQLEWLRVLEVQVEPAFQGRDDVTLVYRLECGSPLQAASRPKWHPPAAEGRHQSKTRRTAG